MTKSHEVTESISDMDIEELTAHASKGQGLIAQIWTLLPELVTLSADDRQHSNGRLSAAEAVAMRKLLIAAGKHPGAFGALADKDGGSNPKVFETQPAIDDLDRLNALQGLSADVASLAQALSDTLLFFGSAAREVGVPVHTLINANKTVDPKLASDAAEGLEFYAAHGRSAARSRARNKAKAAPGASK